MTLSSELRGHVVEKVIWQGASALLKFTNGTYLEVRPDAWLSDLKRRDLQTVLAFTPDLATDLENGFEARGII